MEDLTRQAGGEATGGGPEPGSEETPHLRAGPREGKPGEAGGRRAGGQTCPGNHEGGCG